MNNKITEDNVWTTIDATFNIIPSFASFISFRNNFVKICTAVIFVFIKDISLSKFVSVKNPFDTHRTGKVERMSRPDF